MGYNITFWHDWEARESVHTSSMCRAIYYRFMYKCRHTITHKTIQRDYE